MNDGVIHTNGGICNRLLWFSVIRFPAREKIIYRRNQMRFLLLRHFQEEISILHCESSMFSPVSSIIRRGFLQKNSRSFLIALLRQSASRTASSKLYLGISSAFPINSATCQYDQDVLPRNGIRGSYANAESTSLRDIFFMNQMGSRSLSTEAGDTAQLDPSSAKSSSAIYRVDFEVEGTVQGVFFRKYTQKRATELGLFGWVQNTEEGTVTGQLEGTKQAVDAMKAWLRDTGSPHSHITKCTFKNENSVAEAQFSDFKVRH